MLTIDGPNSFSLRQVILDDDATQAEFAEYAKRSRPYETLGYKVPPKAGRITVYYVARYTRGHKNNYGGRVLVSQSFYAEMFQKKEYANEILNRALDALERGLL